MKTLAELEDYAHGTLRQLVTEYEWHPEDENGKPFDVEMVCSP